MADDVEITAGSGTTIAADDVGGKLHQRVKLSLGADGSAVDAVAGAGNVSTAVQRVTLADDDTNAAAIKTAAEAIQVATEALAALIAGSELQVDVAGALPAGTNAIGKLAANSGVDIGDVDVTSLPASLNKALVGPTGPTAVDSYTSAAISAAANTANQSIISAPGANKQIWVYSWGGTADTGAGSIAFQDEDDTAKTGVMPVAQNGGFSVPASGNFAMPLFKVATNKALEIDTVTCGFKGWISYAIVDVS